MNATRVAGATLGMLMCAGGAAAAERQETGFASRPVQNDATAVALQMAPAAPVAQMPPETPNELVQETLCEPDIVDSRAALNPSCLNVIVDLDKRGNRIDASTRPKKEIRSLCDSMWLPRCRHKY